jgi:hypothetical protein
MQDTPRIVFVPGVAEPMSEPELNRALAGLEDKHPAWLALNQIVLTRWAIAAGDSCEKTLTERAAGHASGRLEEMLALREELTRRRQAAAR